MSRNVLIISTMDGARSCAEVIAAQLETTVELATSKRAGLTALSRGEYAVVVVEQGMVETDPEWADRLWQHGGLAIPVEVNFAISGCARLAREVRSALLRRDQEMAQARRSATSELSNELKSSVAGLLLQSQLALREPSVSPALEPKLRHLVELAGAVRELLRPGL